MSIFDEILSTGSSLLKGGTSNLTVSGLTTLAEAEAVCTMIGNISGQKPLVTQDQTGSKTVYILSFKDESAAINAFSAIIDRQKQKMTTSENSAIRLDMGGVWSGVVIRQFGLQAAIVALAIGGIGYLFGKSR